MVRDYFLEKLTIKQIIKRCGMTQAAFAKEFNIPKRTVENWCSEACLPPDYVKLMIIAILKSEGYR